MNMHVKNNYSHGDYDPVDPTAKCIDMGLKKIRNLRGLTQVQVAGMAEVEQATISRIENNSDTITMRQLRRVAAALNLKPADLIDDRAEGEVLLIQAFRGLKPDRQQGWIDMAETTLAEVKPTQGSG